MAIMTLRLWLSEMLFKKCIWRTMTERLFSDVLLHIAKEQFEIKETKLTSCDGEFLQSI